MMSYLKLLAIGRLGKDVPDLRYTTSGVAVANFSVAIDRLVKGEKKVEWLDVVAFGKTAEACKQYLAKGSQVFIEGTLQTDKWQDQTGICTKTKVIVERIRFLGAPKNHDAPAAKDWEPGAEG